MSIYQKKGKLNQQRLLWSFGGKQPVWLFTKQFFQMLGPYYKSSFVIMHSYNNCLVRVQKSISLKYPWNFTCPSCLPFAMLYEISTWIYVIKWLGRFRRFRVKYFHRSKSCFKSRSDIFMRINLIVGISDDTVLLCLKVVGY